MKQGFTQVPRRITQSGKKLTDAEFRLYCVLLSYDFQKGCVFPGRQRIADQMGASIAKVDRVKRTLELKGAFKKKRRGQGVTNLYFLNENFLFEADNSQMSPLGDSQMSGKEKEDNNTKSNNYLKTSFSSKETNFGEKPQPLSKTQPEVKNRELIFRSQLKRLKTELDAELSTIDEDSLREAEMSDDTLACVDGIIYYLRSYKATFDKDHPLYKLPQLKECMVGFLYGIWEIEAGYYPIEKTIKKAIDHWFATSPYDDNLLKLSAFVGKGSMVFHNSIEAVTIRKKGAVDARHIL